MNRRKFFGLISAACGVALFKPLSIIIPTNKIIGLKSRYICDFGKFRRSVFYQYPAGQSPLMGLLALKDEKDDIYWSK